jgi:hydrogenase maturation protease
MTRPNLVIFGYGNPSRGDDALGPLLLERVEAWIARHPGSTVATVEDFQLQVEHALDLEGCDLALFLDADVSCAGPFRFQAVAPGRDSSFSTHAISPQAVLQTFIEVHHREPPPAFLLGVRGVDFELGAGLSREAEANLESAWTFLEQLLAEPTVQTLSAHQTSASS